MRRKIITIFCVLAAIGALCFVEQATVRRMTGNALAQTDAILQQIRAGEFEQAALAAGKLKQEWEENGSKLEVLIHHGSSDDVRFALSRLLAALEAEDQSSSLTYASELRGSVEHVRARQILTLQNIF